MVPVLRYVEKSGSQTHSMNKTLRVALPISSFLPSLGGMEIGLHNIASRLSERGHRPVVIAAATYMRRLKKEKWDLPYEVIAFPPKLLAHLHRHPRLGFFLFDQFFSWLQRRYAFDVWHVTMGYPVGVAMVHFAQQRPDVRYLIRCAGDDIQVAPNIGYGMRLNPAIDRLVRDYLPRSQMLIAISDSVAKEYRNLGTPGDAIRFVPNGVDLERFASSNDWALTRAEFGLDQGAFLFLSVGRNHPKKNYRTLIRAAQKLRAMTDKPFLVAIAGRGVEELDPDIAASGYPPVHLIPEIGDERAAGKVPAMPGQKLVNLYQSADAFVFPSLMETFGIAIVEAMAAGLPILVVDSAGCRDIVRGGRDGLLVPPEDPEAIAMQMYRLMSDAALRNDYAVRARSRAQNFSWDAVVGRYVDLYQELIDAT